MLGFDPQLQLPLAPEQEKRSNKAFSEEYKYPNILHIPPWEICIKNKSGGGRIGCLLLVIFIT